MKAELVSSLVCTKVLRGTHGLPSKTGAINSQQTRTAYVVRGEVERTIAASDRDSALVTMKASSPQGKGNLKLARTGGDRHACRRNVLAPPA